MTPNINIAEENFQQFIPLLKELYPQDRKDSTTINKFVDLYEKVVFQDNVIIGLYDERKMSVFFLSKNFKKITGYKPSTVLNWKGLVLLKTLHYSHYSYPISTLRANKKFYSKTSSDQQSQSSLYSVGLKFIHADGTIRRAFIKSKRLTWTNNNQPDISILLGQDITHLIKGDHYWLRYQAKNTSHCFVNQKGKKHFFDLISDSELRILKLIAQKKTNAEIADQIYLSKATVETHRKNMIKRVGAVNSTALVHICKMANVL